MRWSDDGEGCESCGYSGVTFCPACRGGGRAVRVTLEIPVEQDELADMAREKVRFEDTSVPRRDRRAAIARLSLGRNRKFCARQAHPARRGRGTSKQQQL